LKSIFIARAGSQFPKVSLASIEQFRAGGAFTVRGYPEGQAVGDYGWNLSTELRVPPLFLPEHWLIPGTKKRVRDAIQLVGFIDGAKTYFRKRATPSQVKDSLLMSTGFGIRVNIAKALTLQFDMGFPFGDVANDKQGERFHISVKTGV